MATIQACYEFASGDRLSITVDIENDFPDAMAEAVKTVKDSMREALVVVSELDDEDED